MYTIRIFYLKHFQSKHPLASFTSSTDTYFLYTFNSIFPSKILVPLTLPSALTVGPPPSTTGGLRANSCVLRESSSPWTRWGG